MVGIYVERYVHKPVDEYAETYCQWLTAGVCEDWAGMGRLRSLVEFGGGDSSIGVT
jgi:hypothetical protein